LYCGYLTLKSIRIDTNGTGPPFFVAKLLLRLDKLMFTFSIFVVEFLSADGDGELLLFLEMKDC